jgi:hypothetical protein
VASSADLVCNIHQNATLFPHFGQSTVVVGNALGTLSESIILSELSGLLSGDAINFFFLGNGSSCSLSAVKPHFGHNTTPCSILGFIRVSQLGQNLKKDDLLSFLQIFF